MRVVVETTSSQEGSAGTEPVDSATFSGAPRAFCADEGRAPGLDERPEEEGRDVTTRGEWRSERLYRTVWASRQAEETGEVG